MRQLSLIFFALLLPGFAVAQTSTVYKHVDKDGKVTYSEKPPAKDGPKADAKPEKPAAKKLDMDKERNVIKSYVPKSSSEGESGTRAFDKRLERNNQLQAKLEEAQKELDEARAALEAGKDPQDDEWQTVGAASGRPTRIPTEAYHQRVKSLEQAVKNAEEKLKRVEVEVRRGTS
ncbi:MAG: DUF4124 domain-containing protein [Betaproteobacteria bacterium]|nr:DUF4124 domain-containing protein [Betaproteobacteria bacterium]